MTSSLINHYGPDVKINPLALGVEIEGIDLREHLDDVALFDRIKADCYKHRIMVFRDQGEIPAESLIKMFERFGSICDNPFITQTKDFVNHKKAPASFIMRISNDETEGFKGLGTRGWHIDGAYKSIPYSHLIFNAVKAPIVGATKFAGHREMLASLPSKILAQVDRIWIVNTRIVLGKKVAMLHPLVYNHPEVDEPVFCFHLGFMEAALIYAKSGDVKHIFSESELNALKRRITQGFERENERFVYSHKWRDGDLVIIDNLQVSHLASAESQMPKEKVGLRILHRLAVYGSEKPAKKENSKKHPLFARSQA